MHHSKNFVIDNTETDNRYFVHFDVIQALMIMVEQRGLYNGAFIYTAAQLSERLGSDQQRASRILRKLSDMGFISRSSGKVDNQYPYIVHNNFNIQD